MIFHLKHWGDLEAIKLLHITYEQASRKPVFQSIRQFTVCNREVKREHFCSQSTKNHWKKVLVCFSCREPPCFCCFVCGEKRPFLIVQVSTVKVMLCLAGVVWCPGLAEAPMPGQGEGELHWEAVLEERVLRQSWLQSGLGVKRR